jgi:hypothetical protein
MTVEVRISSVFIPDGSAPRSGRRAVHVGRTDCTDPTMREVRSTPAPDQVVMKSVSAVMNAAFAGNRTPQLDIRAKNRRPRQG